MEENMGARIRGGGELAGLYSAGRAICAGIGGAASDSVFCAGLDYWEGRPGRAQAWRTDQHDALRISQSV